MKKDPRFIILYYESYNAKKVTQPWLRPRILNWNDKIPTLVSTKERRAKEAYYISRSSLPMTVEKRECWKRIKLPNHHNLWWLKRRGVLNMNQTSWSSLPKMAEKGVIENKSNLLIPIAHNGWKGGVSKMNQISRSPLWWIYEKWRSIANKKNPRLHKWGGTDDTHLFVRFPCYPLIGVLITFTNRDNIVARKYKIRVFDIQTLCKTLDAPWKILWIWP